ncbi:MAG: HAMP domain-containing histidine kinase [Deltaproteobacteria bacterium]|nr:HAMP domain-containing histidine kinase [Deltaproteobacteria bacterium]
MDSHSPAAVPTTPYQRLRSYVGARLQRRLTAWLFASMVLTALIAGGAAWMVGRLASDGQGHRFENVHRLIVEQLALVWDEPAARRELIETLSGESHMRVELHDTAGTLVDATGSMCPKRLDRWPAVRRQGRDLGTIHLCVPRSDKTRLYVGVAFALLLLVVVARLFARQIALPLEEVARVAESVAAGNLDVQSPFDGKRSVWHRDVQLVAETLADMASQVARQLREQRELLAAVSHELRTPLGHLRLLLEQLRSDGPPSADQARRLAQCEREVLDIDAMVGELLANARLEFRELRQDQVRMVDLAIEVLERLGLDPTLLDVECAFAAVVGDATLLQRALANLLDNARRHGHGVKMLRIRSDAGRLRVEVEDDGPGFAEGEAERAFEPFRGSGHQTENLGLGLHLVAKIAQAHGGRAYAGNGGQRGAVVGIELPQVAGAERPA